MGQKNVRPDGTYAKVHRPVDPMHGTPRPRSRERTHPNRISQERNVETLMGTGRGRQGIPCRSVGQLQGCLTPQEETMSQEAKAVSRKATGNWTDRAGTPEIPTSKEGRRGTGAPLIVMMNIGERRCKIDTLCECNRSRRGVTLSLPVGREKDGPGSRVR